MCFGGLCSRAFFEWAGGKYRGEVKLCLKCGVFDEYFKRDLFSYDRSLFFFYVFFNLHSCGDLSGDEKWLQTRATV